MYENTPSTFYQYTLASDDDRLSCRKAGNVWRPFRPSDCQNFLERTYFIQKPDGFIVPSHKIFTKEILFSPNGAYVAVYYRLCYVRGAPSENDMGAAGGGENQNTYVDFIETMTSKILFKRLFMLSFSENEGFGNDHCLHHCVFSWKHDCSGVFFYKLHRFYYFTISRNTWKAKSRIFPLIGHQYDVQSAAFSSDDEKLFSIDASHRVLIWHRNHTHTAEICPYVLFGSWDVSRNFTPLQGVLDVTGCIGLDEHYTKVLKNNYSIGRPVKNSSGYFSIDTHWPCWSSSSYPIAQGGASIIVKSLERAYMARAALELCSPKSLSNKEVCADFILKSARIIPGLSEVLSMGTSAFEGLYGFKESVRIFKSVNQIAVTSATINAWLCLPKGPQQMIERYDSQFPGGIEDCVLKVRYISELIMRTVCTQMKDWPLDQKNVYLDYMAMRVRFQLTMWPYIDLHEHIADWAEWLLLDAGTAVLPEYFFRQPIGIPSSIRKKGWAAVVTEYHKRKIWNFEGPDIPLSLHDKTTPHRLFYGAPLRCLFMAHIYDETGGDYCEFLEEVQFHFMPFAHNKDVEEAYYNYPDPNSLIQYYAKDLPARYATALEVYFLFNAYRPLLSRWLKACDEVYGPEGDRQKEGTLKDTMHRASGCEGYVREFSAAPPMRLSPYVSSCQKVEVRCQPPILAQLEEAFFKKCPVLYERASQSHTPLGHKTVSLFFKPIQPRPDIEGIEKASKRDILDLKEEMSAELSAIQGQLGDLNHRVDTHDQRFEELQQRIQYLEAQLKESSMRSLQ